MIVQHLLSRTTPDYGIICQYVLTDSYFDGLSKAKDRKPHLRFRLDQRIGEVQLPEVILAVDAEVRFSWIMLGREPRSGEELLMAYAGILAPGTSLTATECGARMIPQLSATSIRR